MEYIPPESQWPSLVLIKLKTTLGGCPLYKNERFAYTKTGYSEKGRNNSPARVNCGHQV